MINEELPKMLMGSVEFLGARVNKLGLGEHFISTSFIFTIIKSSFFLDHDDEKITSQTNGLGT